MEANPEDSLARYINPITTPGVEFLEKFEKRKGANSSSLSLRADGLIQMEGGQHTLHLQI